MLIYAFIKSGKKLSYIIITIKKVTSILLKSIYYSK